MESRQQTNTKQATEKTKTYNRQLTTYRQQKNIKQTTENNLNPMCTRESVVLAEK